MIEEKPKSHIHCPRCLEGILIQRGREIFYNKNGNSFAREALQCGMCDTLFKRIASGKITRVFNDSNGN